MVFMSNLISKKERIDGKEMPVVFETERLHLRRITMDDCEWAGALEASPEIARLIDSGPQNPRSLPFQWIQDWAQRGLSYYVIEQKTDGQPVGLIGYAGSELTGSSDFGWRIAPQFWQKGYATEAALALRDIVFATFNIESLTHNIDARNPASMSVAKKLGAVEESSETSQADGMRGFLKQKNIDYKTLETQIDAFLQKPASETASLIAAVKTESDRAYDTGEAFDIARLDPGLLRYGRELILAIDDFVITEAWKLEKLKDRTTLTFKTPNPAFQPPAPVSSRSPRGTPSRYDAGS